MLDPRYQPLRKQPAALVGAFARKVKALPSSEGGPAGVSRKLPYWRPARVDTSDGEARALERALCPQDQR